MESKIVFENLTNRDEVLLQFRRFHSTDYVRKHANKYNYEVSVLWACLVASPCLRFKVFYTYLCDVYWNCPGVQTS